MLVLCAHDGGFVGRLTAGLSVAKIQEFCSHMLFELKRFVAFNQNNR